MRFVILFTAFASLMLQPVLGRNISSVEQQFQQHINFLKEVIPRRKTLDINRASALVSISHKGVPVNFGVIPSSNLPSLVDIHNFSPNSSKSLATSGSSMPSKLPSSLLEIVQPLTSLEFLYSSSTNEDDIVTVPPTRSLSASYSSNKPKTVSKLDMLAEIRRLEQLLVELRGQMSRQEMNLRKQLELTGQTTPTTTASEVAQNAEQYSRSRSFFVSATEDVLSVNDDSVSASKVNGRQIMMRKPPSNSVLIMPQFQHHARHNPQQGPTYRKPKVAWTDFPIPVATASSVTEMDSIETLGVLKEGEYTILFDTDNHIGYIDSNVIQFAGVTDADIVPSTTQYEEYLPIQTSVDGDVKTVPTTETLDGLEMGQSSTTHQSVTSPMTTSPFYDQDSIHAPPKKATLPVHVHQLGTRPTEKEVSTSRVRRLKSVATKSFNFDIFDFDSQTKLNSGSAIRKSLAFLYYIILSVIY
ncbi:hypothetical protein FOB58_000116 [Candida parapsilosis]|uniref:SH3 domain-containing protein n=2 Tax=Candida parapsilosis TaxID=5480 RepID=G8BEF9_CANPC|nr:uncharacterized protein CPAR2_212990 [Candida parapsilosis]KAF6054194.1 hypothetical protein FOB58_000116 [Candida parapsilosis]KAF6056782.1 hypothetical protein FOB59_001294 [Candida parapsilosis]KAF6059717.1 hypothetical protein FOB60_001299 [Candida parapsilosis]KAF6068470.1 hypothetical protein FOB61_001295 [Candida parapsilosis]KAI5902007.1 hypothetical protein K4G60_g1147 [Candida parapsilosis]